MNKDKIIKDLKERNDKLQSQYMQEQARNYHLNYQIENDVLPTLKGYEYEIITLKSDFEAQHELTKKYEQELTNLKAIEKEHQRINGELREENKQYKHIIDELEKWLNYEIYCNFNEQHTIAFQDTLNKLQELKGSEQ